MNPSLTGLLVIDKPAGLTSRAAVDAVQRWFPRGTRIGHTGTLDPLATGVLVLCLGAATRLAEYVQAMSKTYRTGLLLGASSDTDDADGQITVVPHATAPRRDQLEAALATFIGEIDQVPPAFSAAKVAGKRAYDLARGGKEVDLKARRVRIDGIDVVDFAFPRLELEVRCGKGTYIRSLARDLGERLGCGGLVATLRRTRVGPFRAEEGLPLEGTTPEQAQAKVLPLELAVAELPRVVVSGRQLNAFRQGQASGDRGEGGGNVPARIAVFDPLGSLVGIGSARTFGEGIDPVKVFPPTEAKDGIVSGGRIE